MGKLLGLASALTALFIGCAAATNSDEQPVESLWGFTEDSQVRSDLGRTVVVSKTKEQCELNLANTRKQPNAGYSVYSECRELAFGSGDPYWVIMFPPHILIVTAFGTVNKQTCENSRRTLAATSGAALSPCTLTSIQFK